MYPRSSYGSRYPRTNRYNGGQDRPQRAGGGSRTASPKQIATIEKCLPGGEWAKKMDARTEAKIREMLAAGMTGTEASKWMDWLFAPAQRLPRANGGTARAPREITVTEEGFYLLNNEAYKVQRTRDGQRLYAKKATASDWDYEAGKGAIYDLTPEMLMSAARIAEFGKDRGFCVVCSTGFQRYISTQLGIGPTCGPKTMGKDAYNQAKATIIANDPKAAEEDAMLKAQAKARRDASKAAKAAEGEGAVILEFPAQG